MDTPDYQSDTSLIFVIPPGRIKSTDFIYKCQTRACGTTVAV